MTRLETKDLDEIIKRNPALGIYKAKKHELQRLEKLQKQDKPKKQPKKQPVNSESQEQIALFDWARLNEEIIPELKLLHAIPNGGKRHITTAVRLKREGVKSGVPDMFLPVPKEIIDESFVSETFYGLYIEMKVGCNKPTKIQSWWHELLKYQGYKVEVCYSWIEARDIILQYLGV